MDRKVDVGLASDWHQIGTGWQKTDQIDSGLVQGMAMVWHMFGPGLESDWHWIGMGLVRD